MTTRRSLRPSALTSQYRSKAMASPAFERFRFSFFEDPDSPRNGLDMEALAALEGEERSQAEDMLLQYLPDTRGVIGLRFQRPAAHDVPGDVGRRRTARGRQAGHPRGHRRAADLRAMTAPSMSELVESRFSGISAKVAKSPKKRPPNVVRRSKRPGNASWYHRIATRID